MRTIIAGSRTITDPDVLDRAIAASGIRITGVVSGGARGVDALGEVWARMQGMVPTVVPAEWDRYGHAAGPIRNEKMAKASEALIAIWDGESPGTKNMIERARALGLQVFVLSPAGGRHYNLSPVAATEEGE